MNPSFKFLKTIPYIVIAALLVIMFFMTKCQNASQTKLLASIEEYKTDAKTYIDKVGDLVSYNQVLEVNSKEQLSVICAKDKQLADLLKDFKKVESATKINYEIRLVHDTIRFTDSIPCEFVQKYITDSNKWYNFSAYVAPSFFMIDTLRFYNEQSLVIGTKKMGFLKKPERRAEIKNSSPYVIVTNISSAVITEKPKWYQTTLFKFAAGFVTGFIINSRIN